MKELIDESINEMIADEGLGNFLGRASQWIRNKYNNFKADYKAGQNAERWKNLYYDPYEKYGKAGEEMRNLNGPEYAALRYNLTVDRNARAPQYTREKRSGNYGQQNNPQNGNSVDTQGQQHPQQNAQQRNSNQQAQQRGQQKAERAQQNDKYRKQRESNPQVGINPDFMPSNGNNNGQQNRQKKKNNR